MSTQPIRQYLVSCGLLLLPVFVWNIALMKFLPAAFAPSEFDRDIPHILSTAENVLRLLIFALPFLMPLNISSQRQRTGLVIFIAGNIIYFVSWLALIAKPNSPWSQSALGFLAPSYTPILWFVGLALLSRQLFWGKFYRWWMYLALSGLFIISHVSHAAIVYARNY